MAQAEVKITAKALASELEITPKKLRRKLRAMDDLEHTKAERWEFTRREADEIKVILTKKAEVEVEA